MYICGIQIIEYMGMGFGGRSSRLGLRISAISPLGLSSLASSEALTCCPIDDKLQGGHSMGTLMQARIGACALRYEDFDAHQYPRLAAQYQEIKQKYCNSTEMQE